MPARREYFFIDPDATDEQLDALAERLRRDYEEYQRQKAAATGMVS